MEIINQNRHVRDFAHQITKRKLEFPIRKFYIIPTASNCETYKLNKHQKKNILTMFQYVKNLILPFIGMKSGMSILKDFG